jgi:hypothetical protein
MSHRATQSVVAFHERVASLCIDRLCAALNPATGLFDRQLRNRRWEETYDTEDLTSTAICLIGLHRAGIDPRIVGLDPGRTLAALFKVTRRRNYSGGLGLVVWANAVWNGVPLIDLLQKTGLPPLGLSSDFTGRLTTMEAAWLVSGLVHECRRSGNDIARAALEVALADLLARFQKNTGFFCHASDGAPGTHRLRKWVANFADQIYPVQATALVAIARGNKSALAVSEACATRLVQLQGELGQWWWHYDPRDGNVAQAFPVYSVHQHAMAPMALMTLAAAGGRDYRARVELSHAWIDRNELGIQLLDREAGTIWRDIEIQEGRMNRFVRHVRSVLGWKLADGGASMKNLKVNYETRPYEWAWCLFAGAIAAGSERWEHVT